MDRNHKNLMYKGAVMTWECDSNRHMNVMYYINKFEHAGRNLSLAFGLSKSYMQEKQIGIAVVEHNILYKREVFEDDLIHIYSKPIEYSDKVFTVFHEMIKADTNTLAATMNVKLVSFDLKQRKAISLPEDFKKNFDLLQS